jgi:hypothetical protein
MRIRKRYVIPALASLAVLAIGVAPAAANNVSSLSGPPPTAFTPSKAPKTTFKSGKLFVHTHTNYTHPGVKAQGGFAKTVTINFDNDFKFNTAGVPQCAGTFSSTTTLQQAYAACGPNAGASKNALIGTGAASTAPASNFPGCVAAFNGKPSGANPTIVLFTRVTLVQNGTANCANPGSNSTGNTSVTLKGTLTNAGVTDFGKKLTVPNVDTAPLPLDDFTTTVKRGSYVSVRCNDANKQWNTKATFTYSGAGQSPDTASSSQPCTVKSTNNPPDTRITKSKISQKRRKATFQFKSVGTATGFQCQLEGKGQSHGYRSCDSPKTYKHLKPGRYTFKVRAVGPGGKDSSPAKERFKIRKQGHHHKHHHHRGH